MYFFFEDTVEELLVLEQKLAEQYHLPSLHENEIHLALLEMDEQGLLIEDDLYKDWQQTLASYLDWVNTGSPNVMVPTRK